MTIGSDFSSVSKLIVSERFSLFLSFIHIHITLFMMPSFPNTHLVLFVIRFGSTSTSDYFYLSHIDAPSIILVCYWCIHLGHAFHLQCVATWLNSSRQTCPICRADWEYGNSRNSTTTTTTSTSTNGSSSGGGNGGGRSSGEAAAANGDDTNTATTGGN